MIKKDTITQFCFFSEKFLVKKKLLSQLQAIPGAIEIFLSDRDLKNYFLNIFTLIFDNT